MSNLSRRRLQHDLDRIFVVLVVGFSLKSGLLPSFSRPGNSLRVEPARMVVRSSQNVSFVMEKSFLYSPQMGHIFSFG
jgi:hypothetical protein